MHLFANPLLLRDLGFSRDERTRLWCGCLGQHRVTVRATPQWVSICASQLPRTVEVPRDTGSLWGTWRRWPGQLRWVGFLPAPAWFPWLLAAVHHGLDDAVANAPLEPVRSRRTERLPRTLATAGRPVRPVLRALVEGGARGRMSLPELGRAGRLSEVVAPTGRLSEVPGQ